MKQEKPHILIADDELSMRQLLELMLTREGYHISYATSGRDAINMIEKHEFDLVLSDIRLGDMIGLEVLRAAKRKNPATVVIMISAYATAETAVQAMNDGAYDFLPKPFDNKELKKTIAKALELKTVEHEKRIITDALKENLHFGRIIGKSPKMKHVYDMIQQVSKTKTNVLISGESGTGKELIARSIHENSDRCDNMFVAVNCGGIPETLMESEFFGHKKGAFTGASHDKKGLFETAHKGTLFLDEIGEVSPAIQVKLLRAVQDKVIRPVGSNDDIPVDIRIISATNRNLAEEVIAGRFREDLFYRLNVIEIKVPPLRDRMEDLSDLAQHFLEKYSKEKGKAIAKISSYAIELLNRYDFPGNIRELENLIERSVALTNTNIILPDSLAISVHKRLEVEDKKKDPFPEFIDDISEGVSLENILDRVEEIYIKKALEISKGRKERAAKLLNLNMRSLRYRMSKLGIE